MQTIKLICMQYYIVYDLPVYIATQFFFHLLLYYRSTISFFISLFSFGVFHLCLQE